MKKKDPLISVIIACFNSEKFIAPCLDALLASSYPYFSIIVINDASTDNVKKVLTKYKTNKKITIIHSKINHGLAYSNNRGATLAISPYLLFLNPDTEVRKQCLENIVRKFEENRKVSIIQLKLVTKDNRINSAGHFMSFTGFPYDPSWGKNYSLYQKEQIVFGAKNAGLAIREKVFDILNGFDEDYLIYCEDTDLCWRSWIRGYQTWYEPKAISYHFEGSSITHSTKHLIYYEGAKNNLNYIIKDAPFPMVLWMPFFHIIGWLFLSIKLLVNKRGNDSRWIWKGLFWNIYHFRKTLNKRKRIYNHISQTQYSTYKQYMFGPLTFNSLIKRGLSWMTSL